MTKVLYFEGVGMEYEPNQNSDVGNYRIRTSFKNLDGEQFFIDLGDSYRHINNNNKIQSIPWALGITQLSNITDKKVEKYNYQMKLDYKTINKLNYTKEDIVYWINQNLNCDFDTMQIIDPFYGYSVYSKFGYTLMEDIELNHQKAISRKNIFDKMDTLYRNKLGSKYSCIRIKDMDDNSITISCYASDEKLTINNLPRIQKVPVNY